jgi:hypothetical protein
MGLGYSANRKKNKNKKVVQPFCLVLTKRCKDSNSYSCKSSIR